MSDQEMKEALQDWLAELHAEAEYPLVQLGTLIRDPEELHKRIRYLFGLAEEALEEQLAPLPEIAETSPSQSERKPRLATPRQVALIRRLATQSDVELDALLVDVFETEACEHLSRSEASRLIDMLQAEHESGDAVYNGHA